VNYDPSPDYFIGPLDSLTIFVWRNPELSQNVPVRPDGRISIPLVQDLPAAGKTPTQLARDIEDFERIHRTELSRLPHVSRIQSNFALREIINRTVPPAIFGRPGRQARKRTGKPG